MKKNDLRERIVAKGIAEGVVIERVSKRIMVEGIFIVRAPGVMHVMAMAYRAVREDRP